MLNLILPSPDVTITIIHFNVIFKIRVNQLVIKFKVETII